MREWFRGWRRNRILRLHGLTDRDWEVVMQRVPAVARYDTRTRNRLRELVTLFLHSKSIEPARGLTLADADRRLIALQACIPILGLGLEWYAGWHSVVVYPGDFRVRDHITDEMGIVHEIDEARAGEAWPQGPVVLSWSPPADDGGDAVDPAADNAIVVIHEFAHKLDMINGVANGMPPLHSDMTRDEWTGAFTRAYDDFVGRVERGELTVFDDYAATDPAEFFAVASEVFLTTPDRVRDAYPRVYTQLCAFYRQHPHTG